MKEVTIFSTPTCPYCKMAKEYFKKNGVDYKEHDVAADEAQAKIMIDKSYQLFIDKSKKFLDKKVTDLDAKHTTYHDDNQKSYDAIQVTGMSGKNYIIAYTLNESFVFMNPDVKDESDNKIYENYHIFRSPTFCPCCAFNQKQFGSCA